MDYEQRTVLLKESAQRHTHHSLSGTHSLDDLSPSEKPLCKIMSHYATVPLAWRGGPPLTRAGPIATLGLTIQLPTALRALAVCRTGTACARSAGEAETPVGSVHWELVVVQDEAAGGQRREKVEETAMPAMLSPLVPQSGTGTHRHSRRERSYDSHTMSQAPRQLEMRTSRTTPSRSDSSPVITAYGFRNPSISSPGTVETSCQSPPTTEPNPYRSTPATTFTRVRLGSSIAVDRTTAALPSPYTWSRSAPPAFGLCGNSGRKKTGRSTPGPEYTITQSGPACAAHRNVPSGPAAVDAPSAWTASDDCHMSVSDWYSKRNGMLFTNSANRNLRDFQNPRGEKDGYLNWLDPGGSATSLRPKRRQEEVPRGPSGDGGRRRAAWAERSTTTSSRRPLAAKRKELPDAARK